MALAACMFSELLTLDKLLERHEPLVRPFSARLARAKGWAGRQRRHSVQIERSRETCLRYDLEI